MHLFGEILKLLWTNPGKWDIKRNFVEANFVYIDIDLPFKYLKHKTLSDVGP